MASGNKFNKKTSLEWVYI